MEIFIFLSGHRPSKSWLEHDTKNHFLTNQLNYAALTGSKSIAVVDVVFVVVDVVVVKMQKGGKFSHFLTTRKYWWE
jgi:hypothetical protein